MKFGKSLPKSRSGVEVYCLKADSQTEDQSSSLAVSLLDCEPVRLHNTFSGEFCQTKHISLGKSAITSTVKIADK